MHIDTEAGVARYGRFTKIAASCVVAVITGVGVVVLAANFFPDNAMSRAYAANADVFGWVQGSVLLILFAYLFALKLPQGFFSDAEVRRALDDEHSAASKARAFRNGFVAVLVAQPALVGVGLAATGSPSTLTVAVTLASATLLVATVTYVVSYIVYE